MAGATVEIIGESTVGDVVEADLARAKAALAELEQSGTGAGAAVATGGGPGGILSGLLASLPAAVGQISGAILAALNQIAALPPIPIPMTNVEALAAIQGVYNNAQALAATNFDPVRITADDTDVFAKAQAVEQRLAQIKDKTVTLTVNIVTNGSVPSVPGSSDAPAQAHAAGTMSAPGGLSLVGERGPELVNLPRGAQVWGALDSRSMLADQPSGGDTYISALYITAPNNATLTDLLRQAQAARNG